MVGFGYTDQRIPLWRSVAFEDPGVVFEDQALAHQTFLTTTNPITPHDTSISLRRPQLTRYVYPGIHFERDMHRDPLLPAAGCSRPRVAPLAAHERRQQIPLVQVSHAHDA